MVQILFANLGDFLDEHKKYGYPDRHIVRAQVTLDAIRQDGYQVVVTSLRTGQVLRYNAQVDAEERVGGAEEEQACIELRKQLAETLTRERFEVRQGITGVVEEGGKSHFGPRETIVSADEN